MSQNGIADIARAGENLRHDVVQLVGALQAQRETIVSQVRERPAVALGAAFAVGFLLGGGLASRVGSRLLVTGLRLGAAELARRLLSREMVGQEMADDEESWAP